MSEDTLARAARSLAQQVKLERGQGNTRRFLDDHGFPSIVDLERVALGLLSDESGLEDILKRAKSSSEKSVALDTHIEAILRARLFALVAKVAPTYREVIKERVKHETPLNVLLELMYKASGIILNPGEARAIASGFNSFGAERINGDDVLDAASRQLERAVYQSLVGTGATPQHQGLIGVITSGGLRLRYVPTRMPD